ncbi:hypothetical protein CMK13_04650 [Candidatus Poribacteria bacterium]|nr:hypothetical protein [Candidatus Poribacteria bacterium]OUT64468.1 MAG: hypothetical protein CBB75_04355 [bacterium TMED15]
MSKNYNQSLLQTSFLSVSCFLLFSLYLASLFIISPVVAQQQRIAVVVNGLSKFETLSVVNLDHPDPKKAVSADIAQLGVAPNDVQVIGNFAYIVNTYSDNVQAINLKTGDSLGVISTGIGSLPEKIALLNDDRAYVTCNGTDEVVLIDLKGKMVLQRIQTGSKPWGLTILNKKVYVANTAAVWTGQEMKYGQSSISVISTETNQLIKTIEVPTNATSVTSDANNTVLVKSTGDYSQVLGELTLIDSDKDNIKKQISLKSTPGAITVNRNKQQAYILTPSGAIVVDLIKQRLVVKPSSALQGFKGGFSMTFDHQRELFLLVVADWTGGGQDQLLILDSNGKELNRYNTGTKNGKGSSFVALADINDNNDVSVQLQPNQSIIFWGQVKQY